MYCVLAGCDRSAPADGYLCAEHWESVPQELRTRVAREGKWDPNSPAYAAAIDAAIEAILPDPDNGESFIVWR